MGVLLSDGQLAGWGMRWRDMMLVPVAGLTLWPACEDLAIFSRWGGMDRRGTIVLGQTCLQTAGEDMQSFHCAICYKDQQE